MKDINCAAVIAEKRREKGVTQEELAVYLGVTKASVSKWETGISYPDIAFLPILAAYFDISIDQLLNYSQQLPQSEIKKIYSRLAESFAVRPFEDVIDECVTLVKKHYSCFPFIQWIALLYTNHAGMAATDERRTEVFQMAVDLCEHTLKNCREPNLLQEAAKVQAIGYLCIGQPDKVLELLCDENQMPKQYSNGHTAFISQAHQMLGNIEKAKELEQLELYNSFMSVFSSLSSYIRLNIGDYETAKKAYEKAESLMEIFNLRKLNTNMLVILYAVGAHMHQAAGESEKAIETLEKYVDVCINGFFPLVTGDSFFTKIDKCFAEENAKSPLPRSEAVVKESMLTDVLLNPVFDGLRDNCEFAGLVQRLKSFIGGHQNEK